MGSGAKIFLLSLLISLCAFGLVSFAVVSSVKDRAEPVSYDVKSEYTPLDEEIKGESFSNLIVFTENNGSLLSSVLLRYDRERSEITFTPICPKTTVNGTDLESSYGQSGASGLVRGVYLLTGIDVEFYSVVTAEGLQRAVDSIGRVRFTLTESVSAGGVAFEKGSFFLTGEQALALIRYGSAQTYKEDYAASLVRSICERLSESDGETAYAQICTLVTTSFSKNDFSSRAGLISAYGQMTKKTVKLVGSYLGDGQSRYFVSDTEATLDLFSKYRKKYN